MPRIIDFGPPYGQVSYPDDATDQQIVADYDSIKAGVGGSAGPPLSDYYKQAAGEYGRGLTDTLASGIEGAAIQAGMLNKRLPGGLLGAMPFTSIPARALEMAGGEPEKLAEQLLDIGRAEAGLLRRTGRAITPAPVPELQESFLASQVPRGLGSATAFMLGGLGGAAYKVPAWLTTAGFGSLSGTQQFYEDAKAKGADESTAEIAALVGGVVGASEAIPIASWVNRINKATGGTFLKALVHAGTETLEEALQEAAQQTAQNFTAQQLYDKDRALLKDVAANAGVGGVTGFLLSTLSSALGARQRGAVQQPTAPAPPQQTAQLPPLPAQPPPLPVQQPTPPPTGQAVQPDLIPGLPLQGPPPLPPAPTPPTPVPPGQLELQAYAESRRSTPPTTGEQAPGLVRGEEERVRLRDVAPQAPLETQARTPQVQRPPPVTVPGTPSERRTPVLAEIRRANARTIAQIQQLFPQARLNRQQARQLRDQAFPEAVYGLPQSPEQSRSAVDQILSSGAKTPEEIQRLIPGTSPEQATMYRDLAYPNARFGIYEPTVNISDEARKRIAWRQQIHPLGPGVSPGGAEGRFQAIENTYIAAQAAQQALPGVPLKDIMGITIRKGPYPDSPVVDHFFVPRNKLAEFTADQRLNRAYPPGQFTQQIEPGFEPHRPRKGEPSYEKWLASRPAQQTFQSRAGEPTIESVVEDIWRNYHSEMDAGRMRQRPGASEYLIALQTAGLIPKKADAVRKFYFDFNGRSEIGRRILAVEKRMAERPEQSRIEGRTELSIGESAVLQYLRENYGLPVQAQVVVVSEPTAQWDARSIFENGQLIRIELNAANISSLEQTDRAIVHEFSHAVELTGEVADALSLLSQEELDAIEADMTRLGYETGDRHELDARGVETLVNAWKGRNWFEKLVGIVSELASRIGIPMSRLAAERAAARAVARHIKGKAAPKGRNVTGVFESRAEELPNFFQSREQVEAAKADPLLQAYQQQQLEELAQVQSTMVSPGFMNWFSAPAVDEFNQRAKDILEYIAKRANLADIQRLYRDLPSTTPEEKRGKEAIGAIILAHYGVDRATEQKINNDIEAKVNQLQNATAKLPRMNQQNMKAHFLTALFNRLTADHRTYLANLQKNAPAAQNAQAQFRAALTAAERRLNEQVQAPGTLQRALSALAVTVPDNLLQPGTPNAQITQWALNNGALQTVVPQSTQQWLLVDDGSGQPALESYTRLVQDLRDLRDILNNQQQVQADIDAYEQWFSAQGQTGKISPKRFAENYFNFRTQRDRAARIAGAIEKEIGDLDTELRSLQIAQEKLHGLMRDPQYVETVRQAAREADVVVRALHNEANPKVGVGLIDREQQKGVYTFNIPGGNSYTIDLYPTSATEKENIRKLGAFVSEAKQYAVDHAQDDPLLADEYNRLAQYAERNFMHPSLNPENGFGQTGQLGIPGTDIRINIASSPFDWLSSALGVVSFPFNTVRDAIERIGGRATRQMMKDAFELDTVMKKVEGIDNHPKHGFAAQTQAVLAAVASHKWTPDQFGKWDEQIAEPVLAAGQTIGPKYNIGDYVIGSGEKLTKEDVAALNLMKEWQDAVRAVAPPHIKEQLADLQILRKAVGFGRYTMSRTSQQWTEDWVKDWNAATTDAEKIALLNKNENFRRVVMSYMGEFNPELGLANNASDQKSPLFSLYRRLAETEKSGVQQFKNTDQVLDFIASEAVDRGLIPAEGYAIARNRVEQILLGEIDKFTKAFKANVLDAQPEKSIWGGVPQPVVDVSTAKNTFTTPRGPLQAPSSFYSYSVGQDGRRQQHIGSLRSLMNLKLLQSIEEARTSMEAKKNEMDKEITRQINAGKPAGAAKRSVVRESKRQRKLQEIQHDYQQLVRALKILETVGTQLRAYEQSAPNHYQHAGIETLNAVTGTMKSGLLASTQAVSTNTWGGLLLGPALFHWQTGEYLKALRDVLPAPIGTPIVWNQLYKRLNAMVANNPVMSKLLKQHTGLFKGLAEHIISQSEEWKRIQRIAETSGMVSPYNLRNQWRNRRALPAAGGRLTTERDVSGTAQFFNRLLSAPGIGKGAEAIKAVFPRKFDDFINYALIMAFDKETEMLKRRGFEAFQAREDQAKTSGRDYTNLSDKNNVLGPKELGLVSNKGLERYRQIFAPLGSLDRVLLDYYERTKGMTAEQREQEPLIPDDNDHAALALYYASISNPATETNRPLAFKRKGGSPDAALRATAGTFMGWVVNFVHQLSKGLQTHSADKNFPQIAHGFIGLAMITILLAAVGAWNWEFGDELTKKLTNVSSARIQPGNIQDVPTALGYLAQALVNTVPIAGPILGSAAGVAFTGRGNPFDMTSQILHLNFASDTYNTIKRSIQTNSIILPWADWARRWIFPSFTRAILNDLPVLRGLLDQQNAVRSLNGSAPPGTEIKWGQARGGEVKYSPANDELNRIIAAAYEATAHGGNVADVQIAIENAVQAYIRAGRTRADAEKAVNVALAGKEPIRILTGREMTPEEEVRWVGRMTKEQRADYDKAKAAWALLGNVTGRDLGFVNEPSSGGSRGGGRIAGLPATLPQGGALAIPPSLRPPGIRSGGLLRAPRGGLPTLRIPRGTGGGGVAGIRPIRPNRGRLRRPGLRRPRLRRAAGPRVSAPRIRQRRITGRSRLR